MKKIRQITAYILVLILLCNGIYRNGHATNAEAIDTETTLYFVDNTSEQWIRNNNDDSVKEGTSDGEIDSDQDGIINIDEINLGTDPDSPDTDEDGLTDYDEIHIYNTDPKNADTDNDKIKDGDEIALGLNPLVADTDGNGIIDGEEYIEQKVNTDRFDGDLYEDNAAVPVALTVSAQGNVNSNLKVSEYTGCDRGDSRSYVGKPIEISGAEMNGGSITFELDDSYQVKDYKFYGESTNGLLICYYNGEEFTQPLDTIYDETTKTLTADIVGPGMYFVLDVMDWIDSLGIEYSNSEPDDTEAGSLWCY